MPSAAKLGACERSESLPSLHFSILLQARADCSRRVEEHRAGELDVRKRQPSLSGTGRNLKSFHCIMSAPRCTIADALVEVVLRQERDNVLASDDHRPVAVLVDVALFV